MSVYITKNAINNIPLPEKVINGDESGGQLTSQLLSSNKQLKRIASNNVPNCSLKIGMENEAVGLIKVALNFIDEQNGFYPQYNITPLNTYSYKFDENLKEAIEAFQIWSEIKVTREIDTETLLKIDSKFSGKELFDAAKKKYIGEASDIEFSIQQEKSLINNKYSYSISLVGYQKNFKIETSKPLNVKKIKNKQAGNSDKLDFVVDEKTKQEIIENNPEVKKFVNESEINNPYFSVNPENTKIVYAKLNIPITDYDLEETNTPPNLFNDEDAKLHKIEFGDTPSKIVLENYYGEEEYLIRNPYNNDVIFSLPKRTPFPASKRSEDARFQFYLNLLYYYNSEQQGTNLKEWGLKKADAYERYSIDHLDNVNIFENKFDSQNPDTGLPNYYRFLKKMEAQNADSKIKFDDLGNTTSFETVVNKNIRIPSRKFADSMYYFLNFRHNEMLVPTEVPPVNPDDEPTSIMDYITDAALDAIVEIVTDVIDIAEEVKADAIALYKEAADFFNKVYNFAIDFLTQYWPRGAGGKVALGASVTWGIPIETEGKIEKSLWRKMSTNKELTIMYKKESTLGIGTSTAAGLNCKIGGYSGHGRANKKGLGIDVGASASASLKTIVSTEYEFPIRKDETALLTMIITVFGGSIVSDLSDILNYLDIINLDSRQYITKLEVKLEGNTKGKICAKIGGPGKKGLSMPNGNADSVAEQDRNNNHGSVDNIFSKLPGFSSELELTGCVAFEYKVKYGTNPHTSDHATRVFEVIEIDRKLSIQTKLTTELVGSFFQKLFVNSTPVGAIANTIFDLLTFDMGAMLGVHYKLERKTDPNSIKDSDFKFNVFDQAALNSVSGRSLKYTPNGNVSKEVSFYFGTFSGDAGSLCEPGTEVKYNIDPGVLHDMWYNRSNYVYSFDNVFKLFKSIEYHKKVGFFNYDPAQKKKIVKKTINDNALTSQVIDAHRSGDQSNTEISLTTAILDASLKNISSKNFFVSGGLALDIKMEIKFDNLKNIIEFYFRKLYLKYVLNPGNKTKYKFIEDGIDKQKDLIDAALKAIPEFKEKIGGKEYYELLYSNEEVTPESGIKGLLGYITDEIPSGATANYKGAAVEFVKGLMLNISYLNGIIPENKKDLDKMNDDYGITKIIHAFTFIPALAGLEVTLEAKAGLGFGGSAKAGEGLTVGVALDALAEVNYQGALFENGKLTDVGDGLLSAVFKKIEGILGLPNTNKQIGAKTVFRVLEK
ncbi:hypothetical protein N4T20_10360 [Flavobacterium sp. TR2]|uniref:hypothetical protein n=1 Tax=Flavobacterium sp. TR2 TaxID=2977321 RepID=UPI0021B1099D|nr:hypothetical protein [Flavobacterium sp. TR2]UWY30318.1 hypothetical protein N4T20_10360 [Flavobacterium sp. TR2]